MRIILLGNTADPSSGWGAIVHNHAASLWRAGIPFTLLLPHNALRKPAPFSGSVRYSLPDLPLTFGTPASCWKAMRLLPSVDIGSEPIALVHALTDFPYSLVAHRIASVRRTPLILNAVGTYSVAPFGRFPDSILFRKACRDAARIIAISEYTAHAMRAASGAHLSIDVMHLPVARPLPDGCEDRSILESLPQGKRFILTIAPPRLAGRKGLDVLLDAFPSVVRHIPDAHLIVVGNGSLLAPHCTGLPAVSGASLAALFGASSLFAAFPRVQAPYFEGYGLVYLEAGSYGLPVVASRSGGIPEAVHDGKTGILVQENDPSAAAEAIVRIMTDADFARRLGHAGRMLAERRNWDAYMSRMIVAYRECVSIVMPEEGSVRRS